MENLIKSLIEKTKLFLKKVTNYLTYNKSFIYIFMSIFIVFGYGFFLNSNSFIKTENKKSYTTPIEEIKTLGKNNIQVRSRKYSKTSNIVEFYIYCETPLNSSNIRLRFELREQKNPLEVIDTDVRRLDENNYIVRAKVNNNWSVLSLGVGEFIEENILDNINNSNEKSSQNVESNTVTELVKFYVEKDDIETVLSLKEKTANEYLSEGIDIEIDILNKKIKDENSNIKEKNTKIKDLEETIKRRKEEEVYQTEIEIKDSENKINSIQDAIKTLQNDIENSNKNIQLIKEKIQKLREKKSVYQKVWYCVPFVYRFVY